MAVETVLRRWSNWKERARFRFTPPVVDWLVHLTTYQAQRRLKQAPLRVLVDVNVIAHAVTHETQWVQTGFSDTWNVPLGYMARVPVHSRDCDTDVYRSVKLLPGIASLARRGFLVLKTSTELQAEEYRLSAARLRGGSIFDYHLFRDVKIECVDGRYASYAFSDLADKHMQRARLDSSDDPLFRALRVHLKQRSFSQDAWHIRTAEASNCFCFLTMDFKLLEAVRKFQLVEPFASLKTKILSPEEFGEHLAIHPIPTFMFSYHNASFPVRSDLNQPNSERAKRRLPSDN